MKLGLLGEQVVLKSKKAFSHIKYMGNSISESDIWYPRKELRDKRARSEYLENREVKRSKDDVYMLNILNEEMKPGDVRLR